jgi:hypothetical protein
MQAIFDPLQGFFNAILFVFLSANDRQNIFFLFCLFPLSLCSSKGALSLSLEENQQRRPSPHRQAPRPRPLHPRSPSPLDDSAPPPAPFLGYQPKKKKYSFFQRMSSLLTSSSSSFSTSLLSPQQGDGGGGRERAPQSSSQRSDGGYSSQYPPREGADDSEGDHVGLSRISESATTARDSDGYRHQMAYGGVRDASFVYDNESQSEYSVNK